MFTAIVFVLVSGCVWRRLPPWFDVVFPTGRRRFAQWTEARLWRKLHRAVLDERGRDGLVGWSRVVVDSVQVRAKKEAL